MINGIDISSWEGDIDLAKLDFDFVIVKATEGTGYINPYCDEKVQQAIELGKKWGFYHFASGGDAVAEADYFVDNCANYFHYGVPVLDFEANAIARGASWAKKFLDRVYERTGVRALIYMSQSVTTMYDWSSVAENHGLWVAKYPNVIHPNFDCSLDFTGDIGAWDFIAIWQYCSDGRIDGYNADLDLNRAYMTLEAWDKYAGTETASESKPNLNDGKNSTTLENDKYRITIEEK